MMLMNIIKHFLKSVKCQLDGDLQEDLRVCMNGFIFIWNLSTSFMNSWSRLANNPRNKISTCKFWTGDDFALCLPKFWFFRFFLWIRGKDNLWWCQLIFSDKMEIFLKLKLAKNLRYIMYLKNCVQNSRPSRCRCRIKAFILFRSLSTRSEFH